LDLESFSENSLFSCESETRKGFLVVRKEIVLAARKWSPMPYIPYWFESFAPCFPWIVPGLALAGLWFARSTHDRTLQILAERVFFAVMLIVAAATLRTVLANDGCWLLHMGSIGIMVLGATIPQADSQPSESEGEVALSDH